MKKFIIHPMECAARVSKAIVYYDWSRNRNSYEERQVGMQDLRATRCMFLYNRIAARPSRAIRLAPDAEYALFAEPRNGLLVVVAAGAPPGEPPVAVPTGAT